MIQPVVRLPARVLKTVAADADPLSAETVALGEDLVDTMRSAPGCVGLAAPQIGVGLRVFCLDVTGHKKARSCHGLLVLANPVVVSAGALELAREGCMSVPDFTGNVARASHVVVRAYDVGTGELREVDADGIEARGLLHEIDHVDGLVFLDRVASARTDVFARKRYL